MYSPEHSQSRYNYVPPTADSNEKTNPSVRSFNIVIQRSPTEYDSMGESKHLFKQPVPANPIEHANLPLVFDQQRISNNKKQDDGNKYRALMTGKVAPYDLAGDLEMQKESTEEMPDDS